MSDKNKVNALSKCLVTGGAGFLGRNIAKALREAGCEVVIFDRAEPVDASSDMPFVKGDVTDKEALLKAMEGIDCVFHTAAVIELGGGPSAPYEYRQLSIRVNVEGTKAVIAACQEAGVARLVYTSSNNVCFSGRPVSGLNSSSAYADRVYDMYTETKIAAEKLVLKANGEKGLCTVAIRPAGIYGAESNVMLDKFVEQLASGKLVAALGNPNAVHENAFIDNLVHAHILAGERAVEGNRCCGRSYFISDNEPQNYFEFFRPLIDGLGYQFPKVWVPMNALLPIMRAWQFMHFRFGLPKPLLTPKELDKVCVTHISDPKESKDDLDYTPLVDVTRAMELCLPYCQQLHDKHRAQAA